MESSNTLNTHEGVDDSSSSAVSGPALQRPIPQREAQGLSAMVRWPLVLGGSDTAGAVNKVLRLVAVAASQLLVRALGCAACGQLNLPR